jgi:hypothetical protein
MKFLDGNNVKKEIKNLVGSGSTLKIAVAYWGKGATKELGLDKLPTNSLVTVICDLMSGACNPKEISCLRKHIGNDAVKQLDGLHAKVWLTENGAIIGSSNASANGLGFEGNETKSLIEANLFITNQDTLKSIDTWFENLNHRKITDKDLKRAEKLWKRRRVGRSKPEYKNLYKSIAENPHDYFDRDVVIWAFEHEIPTKQEIKYAEKVVKSRGYSEDSVSWYYDVDASTLPGSHIIDFDYTQKSRNFTYSKTSQVLEHEPFQSDGKHSVLLCKETDFCHVSRKEMIDWKTALRRAVRATPSEQNNWQWRLEDFHQYMIDS